jgi:NAD+ kinase
VLVGKTASKKDQAHLVSDGQKILNLNFGDEIYIQKAKRDHLMIQQPNYDYFNLLRQKLKFGDRS